MGMHFGILAVAAPWNSTFSALCQQTGDFIPQGEVAPTDDPDLEPNDDGFYLLAGEHAGRSYILDTSMVLSCGDYDRLLTLSSDLACTVGAVLGETTSGTFSFFAAEHGHVTRLYFSCHSSITKPFTLGSPLAAELTTPFEDVDGIGLITALDSLGFRSMDWQQQAKKQRFLYTCKEFGNDTSPTAGPISQQIEKHQKAYAIPKHLVPQPTVVSRRLRDGSVGFDILPSKPSFFARLRHLLGL